jgi:DNA-binding ferritin-like protein
MAEENGRWDEVAERFSELGHSLKDRFDANAAYGPAEREKVNEALHQLAEALDAGFTTIGDALRDPAIRDEMKRAGSSITDALAATLRDVSDSIKRH